MVPQILESLVSNVLTVTSSSYHNHISPSSISVFLLGSVFVKSALNETDAQIASIHLFLIILIVFIMISTMKDAQ